MCPGLRCVCVCGGGGVEGSGSERFFVFVNGNQPENNNRSCLLSTYYKALTKECARCDAKNIPRRMVLRLPETHKTKLKVRKGKMFAPGRSPGRARMQFPFCRPQPCSKSALPDGNESHMCNFKFCSSQPHFKNSKKKGEISFSNIFYLDQYIQNIINT